MIILCTAFGSLEEYLSFGPDVKPALPAKCPGCGQEGTFRRHGSYWRKVLEGQRIAEIKIRRCRCKRCHLVASLLYAFLLPYRRFSVRSVATAVEGYICEPGSYGLWAYMASCLPPEHSPEEPTNDDERVRPHRSQPFRWINALATASAWLLHQVQKELLLSGKAISEGKPCPNALQAVTGEKRAALNTLSAVLTSAKAILEYGDEIARQLHAYFLSSAETRFGFLIGTPRSHWIPQSSQRVIF